jgi:class 3 adenylate cyclase
VLFSDVSGFTQLTERLQREKGGEEGAETLSAILVRSAARTHARPRATARRALARSLAVRVTARRVCSRHARVRPRVPCRSWLTCAGCLCALCVGGRLPARVQNSFFAQLITVVHDHDGDVIKFAGARCSEFAPD